MTVAARIADSERDREGWKYTSLKALRDVTFAAPTGSSKQTAALAGEGVCLVFIDGIYDRAASRLGNLPQDVMQAGAGGYRLELGAQNCLVTTPIELRFVATGSAVPVEAGTQLQIRLGANTRVTLIERHVAQTGAATAAHVVNLSIELESQAKLVHGKIASGGDRCVHLARTRVAVAKGAYYDQFALLLGGAIMRNESDVTLAGELAQCQLQGIMLLRGTRQADTTTRITHAAPNAVSRQIYKSVIGDKAKGVFQGKIIVARDAQKTDGYQLSRALLLSDQAEMNAKPELEIYADDVKCSHGSTIGDLDEQALFYLQARGIPADAARSLLIRAFVSEQVDAIQAAELRAVVEREVGAWLD